MDGDPGAQHGGGAPGAQAVRFGVGCVEPDRVNGRVEDGDAVCPRHGARAGSRVDSPPVEVEEWGAGGLRVGRKELAQGGDRAELRVGARADDEVVTDLALVKSWMP